MRCCCLSLFALRRGRDGRDRQTKGQGERKGEGEGGSNRFSPGEDIQARERQLPDTKGALLRLSSVLCYPVFCTFSFLEGRVSRVFFKAVFLLVLLPVMETGKWHARRADHGKCRNERAVVRGFVYASHCGEREKRGLAPLLPSRNRLYLPTLGLYVYERCMTVRISYSAPKVVVKMRPFLGAVRQRC